MTGFSSATAVALCALLGGCASATPADTSADAGAIAAVNDAWGKAYNAGDAAGLVAAVTPRYGSFLRKTPQARKPPASR